MRPLLQEIDAASFLGPWDVAIFALVLAITVANIIFGNLRKHKTSGEESDKFLDHFLMGRRLTLPLFVGTLVATWYGGIFGVTKIAFESGIYMFVTQGFFWYLTYIIFALFIVPKVHASGAITLPELVGNMYGEKASYVAAVFNFFNVLPIAYALSLGIFINLIFGLSVPVGTFVGTLVVCIYSWWGGFRADVYSDMVQFFTMCISVFLVLAFSVFEFGGIDFLRLHLPATFFDPTGGVSIATTLVWGFIALSTLVDPNFYQRCFAATSKKTARNGILISTVIWCGFDLCTTFGSMYARVLVPEANAQHAYMTYALQILPTGLRGFFVAGIVCTVISTIDSYILVASNTLTYDLGPEKYRRNVFVNKIGILAIGLAASFLSLFFEGSIKDIWKTFGSYSAGCLLFPVLLGYIFPGRISGCGFLTGCGAGVVSITYWRFVEHTGFWANIDDLYVGVIFSCLGVLIGTLISPKIQQVTA